MRREDEDISHRVEDAYIYVQAPRELYIRASKTLSFSLSQGFFSRWPNLSSPAHLILSVVFSPPFPLYIYIYIYHRYGPSAFSSGRCSPSSHPLFRRQWHPTRGKTRDRPTGQESEKAKWNRARGSAKSRVDPPRYEPSQRERRWGEKGKKRSRKTSSYCRVCVCVCVCVYVGISAARKKRLKTRIERAGRGIKARARTRKKGGH